ncbi:MAG: NAD(P)-binding domain-containing protein, partial [Miltoncostaeaceae bacterium]
MSHPAPAIGVVGVGAMGGAMAAGLARHARVIVEDQAPGRADEVAAAHGVEAGDAASCDVVVLAVKPQDLADVLGQIVPRLRAGAVVASVAAGWP